MTETMQLALAVGAGAVLGVLFFGGLWWTVRKGLASPYPARWFLGSLLLRTGLVLGGFYLVADGDWRRLVACVAGFTVARLVVTRRLRRIAPFAPEARHAP